jgi:entericidin B
MREAEGAQVQFTFEDTMEAVMIRRMLALIALGLTLAGCNTMSGIGRDIERGGEKLQGEARETQQNMRRN